MKINMNTDFYISSLDNVIITNERRDGNTTRIINNVIELLFKNKTISLEDHNGENRLSDKKRILFLVERRLSSEFDYKEGDLDIIESRGNLLIAIST